MPKITKHYLCLDKGEWAGSRIEGTIVRIQKNGIKSLFADHYGNKHWVYSSLIKSVETEIEEVQ